MVDISDLYPTDTTDGDLSRGGRRNVSLRSSRPVRPSARSINQQRHRTCHRRRRSRSCPRPTPGCANRREPRRRALRIVARRPVSPLRRDWRARRYAVNAVTGNASVKRPDLPWLDMPGLGLGVTDPKAWGIVGQEMLSRDPAALARVIKERLPNATVDWDQKTDQGGPASGANLTVQVPGGPQMYLDRPGLTPQKALFYGPQTAAAVLSGGKSLPVQMGLQGLQHALSNLGSYGLGGATSPVDPVGTAISTLAPAAFGAAGAGLIKGYDWLNSEAASSADAIAARAKALVNFNFAGKTGDITGDPGQLATEDLATNAGSDAAKAHMKAFHDYNVGQNQANKRQIIGNIAGDAAPDGTVPATYQPNESQFGDRLNSAVTNQVQTLTDAEKAAWAKVGDLSPTTQAGQSVQFSPDVSADVLGKSATTVNRFFGAPQGPAGSYSAAQLGENGQLATNAFDQIKRIMQPTVDGSPGPLSGFNLGHLQDIRQQLQNVVNDAPGSPAAAAATQMRRQLDDSISAAETTPGQMSGDPTALTNFRDANAATKAKYAFTEPRDNPAAERFVANVTNPAAPNTGQQSISSVFGGTGGVVTPGGGTNPIIMHLTGQLGDDATQPLGGALALRSLYGNKGTSEFGEGDTARPLFDYNSTSDRITGQLAGQGRDVSNMVLSPEARQTLADYSNALDVLGTANRASGPRLNAPGSGYVGMLTRELPFGAGRMIDKVMSTSAAKNATQTGAEIMQRASEGATTPAGLQITLPRQSTLPPTSGNPFYNWQPEAWRAGTPLYRAGGAVVPGLLGY